ncbi:MAG: DUF2330 domain-containing protein, partial [Nannocystaceae bacterium]
LGENGYQQDAAAAPIFEEYLSEGYKFAAFKLSQSAEIDSIHPVVLEYEGAEACVPIRLTRIAAEEDMEIRAFFLGNNRTVPTNYRHVLVNHVKIDWFNLGSVASQYKELITLAVDAFKADGHAFVTEYAGNSNVVTRTGIYDSNWQSAPFVNLDPAEAAELLFNQDILQCFDDFCNYSHPLLQSVLNQYLPVPEGMTDGEFYSCLECFPVLIDQDAWGNGQGFADAYETRIIDPGKRANELLDTWPYLSRLYTTISPGEMTEDPTFHQNPSLDDVSNILTANRYLTCDGDRVMNVPPGREIFVPGGQPWPSFGDEMPYTHEVQTVALEGAPQVLVDNDPIIVDLIDKWNASHNWPPPDTTGTSGGSTDSNGTGNPTEGTGTDTDGSQTTAGPTGTDAGTSDTATGTGQDGEGCGCRQSSPTGGALALGFGFALLAWTRRRT